MLNAYHLAFLNHLNEANVRYLVIGGQARFLRDAQPTVDLDIWVEFETANVARFEIAFFEWIRRYRNHSCLRLSQPSDANIKFNSQIHLPDDDVGYCCNDGTILQLCEANKIDIIFCFDPTRPAENAFPEHFEHGLFRDYYFGEVRFSGAFSDVPRAKRRP